MISSSANHLRFRQDLVLVFATLLMAVMVAKANGAEVGDTWHLEDNPVVAMTAALPPTGRAVIMEVSATITSPDGDKVKHVAIYERNLHVIHIEYLEPSAFRGDRALVKSNIIHVLQKRGGIQNYSGVLRSFEHLPLFQAAQVLFLDPSKDYVGKRLPDTELEGETLHVYELLETSTSNPFEWIKILYHDEDQVPVRAIFHSEDHIHTLTADYTFGHQVMDTGGSRPFMSRIQILEEPEGRHFDLRVGEPKVIDEWKIKHVLH